MASSSPALSEKTEPLYQKDSTQTSHTSTINTLSPLSSLPADAQSLFSSKSQDPDPDPLFILTAPQTIFHPQGGGQPSDTGTLILVTPKPSGEDGTFKVLLCRKYESAILHLGSFLPATSRFEVGDAVTMNVDVDARRLNSKLHTAGHALSLAIRILDAQGKLGVEGGVKEVKASHYPGAAFVEFSGLIPGSAKQAMQDKVDELVSKDLGVHIHFWSEEEAKEKCDVVLESVKGGEEGVRVVQIGEEGKEVGRYPCGGTHVGSLKELGKVVVRGIKRQKGISKVGYEVVRAES